METKNKDGSEILVIIDIMKEIEVEALSSEKEERVTSDSARYS